MTEAQAACLYEKGCDLAQGYLFGPAVASDQVKKLIAEPNRLWCSVD